MEITITPPIEEGLPRVYRRTDNIPAQLMFDVIHHFETGLNRSRTYKVNLTNPRDNNTVDLRYVRVIDAAPTAYVKYHVFTRQDEDTHLSSSSSAPLPSNSARSQPASLSSGSVAGVVVGLICSLSRIQLQTDSGLYDRQGAEHFASL